MSRPNLYRKYFTPAERRALAATPENDVTGEVNLLRIMLLRFLAAGAGAPPPADLKSHLESLRVTSVGAAMIACLIRTQARAGGLLTDLDRALDEALAGVNPYLDGS
jgi:hypothetical protein